VAELLDFASVRVRLTDERLAHILEHPEMQSLVPAIAAALASPNKVVESVSDSSVHLYYTKQQTVKFGEKWLCVVVKFGDQDAFVLTASLTDQVKKGTTIWNRS